jgi:hypothetical protein
MTGKEVLRKLGFDYNRFFLRIKRVNAERLLKNKMDTLNGGDNLKDYDLSIHFAHETLDAVEDQLILKSSIIDRIAFLKECFSKDEIATDTFLDLGDPSGVFLKSLGRTGVSYNISEDAVRNARRNGMDAIRGDIGSLPLRRSSVDHIFLFQTLEHLPDPIGILNRIFDVNKKSLTISVPHVKTTLIHRKNYAPAWRSYEHHIFEFSDNDLRKIISHTPYRMERMTHAVMFDQTTGTLKERIGTFFYNLAMAKESNDPEYYPIADDLFYGSFKRLTLMHLRRD